MEKKIKEFEETVNAIQKLKAVQESELLEPIQKGKWSIREIIGHLYYWDQYNLEKMVPLMESGANLPEFPNHDQHNEKAINYLKDKSVESIIDAFIETRKDLIKSIAQVERDARFTIGKGKRKFSSESFINIFLQHDQHHLHQIKLKL